MRTDEERLRLFCDLVNKALARRAVADRTMRSGLTMRFGQFEGPQVETNLGDQDDTHALMIDVRKFVAKKKDDDVFFPHITAVVARAVTDDELRAANANHRANWKLVLKEGLVQIDDGQYRTPAAWFDLIMNGEVFHNDSSKLTAFQSLPDDVQAIARASVNAMLVRVLHILRSERLLIEEAFERDAFDFSRPFSRKQQPNTP
jgi:hypothetical protein